MWGLNIKGSGVHELWQGEHWGGGLILALSMYQALS